MVSLFFCHCAENNVWVPASQVRLQLLNQLTSWERWSLFTDARILVGADAHRPPAILPSLCGSGSTISSPRGEGDLQVSPSAASLSFAAAHSFSACQTGHTPCTGKLTEHESFPHCRSLPASGSGFGVASSPRALAELCYTFSLVEGRTSDTGKMEEKHEMKYCGLTHPQPSVSILKIICIWGLKLHF